MFIFNLITQYNRGYTMLYFIDIVQLLGVIYNNMYLTFQNLFAYNY